MSQPVGQNDFSQYVQSRHASQTSGPARAYQVIYLYFSVYHMRYPSSPPKHKFINVSYLRICIKYFDSCIYIYPVWYRHIEMTIVKEGGVIRGYRSAEGLIFSDTPRSEYAWNCLPKLFVCYLCSWLFEQLLFIYIDCLPTLSCRPWVVYLVLYSIQLLVV